MKLDSFCRRLQKIVMIALYIKTDSIYISILNVLFYYHSMYILPGVMKGNQRIEVLFVLKKLSTSYYFRDIYHFREAKKKLPSWPNNINRTPSTLQFFKFSRIYRPVCELEVIGTVWEISLQNEIQSEFRIKMQCYETSLLFN